MCFCIRTLHSLSTFSKAAWCYWFLQVLLWGVCGKKQWLSWCAQWRCFTGSDGAAVAAQWLKENHRQTFQFVWSKEQAAARFSDKFAEIIANTLNGRPDSSGGQARVPLQHQKGRQRSRLQLPSWMEHDTLKLRTTPPRIFENEGAWKFWPSHWNSSMNTGAGLCWWSQALYLYLPAWLWQWFTQGDNILNVVAWKPADVKCLPSQHRRKLKPLWSSHRQEIQPVCNLRKEMEKVQLSWEEKRGLFICFWKTNKLFLPVILFIWRAGLLEAFKSPQINGSVGQKAPYGAL